MNTRSSLLILLTLMAARAPSTAAALFASRSFTLHGGSVGTTTDGRIKMAGTVGQPNAGVPLTTGTFALTGGFWAGVVSAPSPAAPPLKIEPWPALQVRLSWPQTAHRFVLEQVRVLSLTGSGPLWSPVLAAPVTNQSQISVVIPAAGNNFFRLRKP